MSDIAIKAEDITKLYRLGEVSTGTISHDLNRWWARVKKKRDPFAIEKNAPSLHTALQNVTFSINKGDTVGIIGGNGAGKSTLLKILSKITTPTSGRAYISGRIASLLEVGTGFHKEMTGRENVYLNGAILGMTKKEISRKFDEIIAFSGVEKYIDTPVKRYSSGMYVRLAFAVAAHLDSEILIVDEVLAVGDIDFQQKCLGKMSAISKQDGRTVLFVSHNMAAIRNLCRRGILLHQGQMAGTGAVEDVLAAYFKKIQNAQGAGHVSGNGLVTINDFSIQNRWLQPATHFFMDEAVTVEFSLAFQQAYTHLDFGLTLRSQYDTIVTHITNLDDGFIISGNKGDIKKYRFTIPGLAFAPGLYTIDIGIVDAENKLQVIQYFKTITLLKGDSFKRPGDMPAHVISFIPAKWQQL